MHSGATLRAHYWGTQGERKMALFTDSERVCADAFTQVGYCNPFLAERLEHERTVLGDEFVGSGEWWYKQHEVAHRPNIDLLTRRARRLAEEARERLCSGTAPAGAEAELYQGVVLYFLYNKYQGRILTHILQAESPGGAASKQIPFYSDFKKDFEWFCSIPGLTICPESPAQLFSFFFQLRRAFYHIFDKIIGGSIVSARLRAAVWQSVFTCDMRRYRRGLYARMDDITTLVTGPSGTGKELVARRHRALAPYPLRPGEPVLRGGLPRAPSSPSTSPPFRPP